MKVKKQPLIINYEYVRNEREELLLAEVFDFIFSRITSYRPEENGKTDFSSLINRNSVLNQISMSS